MRLVPTALGHGSVLVRFHPDDGSRYDRMIVVTPEEDGRVLHLMGWIGAPLTPAEWQAARDTLFPKAREVQFERLTGAELVEHRLLLR